MRYGDRKKQNNLDLLEKDKRDLGLFDNEDPDEDVAESAMYSGLCQLRTVLLAVILVKKNKVLQSEL